MFCTHGRLSDSCEDCAYVRGAERRGATTTGGAPVNASGPGAPLEVAQTDLLINDPRLAPDTEVLVRKGDGIPWELAGHPRRELPGYAPGSPGANPTPDAPKMTSGSGRRATATGDDGPQLHLGATTDGDTAKGAAATTL